MTVDTETLQFVKGIYCLPYAVSMSVYSVSDVRFENAFCFELHVALRELKHLSFAVCQPSGISLCISLSNICSISTHVI